MYLPAVNTDAPTTPQRLIGYLTTRSLLRLRFQLLFLLGVAALAPALVRGGFTISGIGTGNNLETMIGAAAAALIGCFAHRRLSAFPGTLATTHIVPAFTAAFGLVMLVYFFFRIDYARSTFAAGYTLSVIWSYLVTIAASRLRRLHLGFVPIGAGSSVELLPGVNWRKLSEPTADTCGLDGVVVDLRAELSDEWETFIANTALEGRPVYHVKQIGESLTGRVEIEHLSENTLGSINPNHIYLSTKEVIDWLGAFIALFFLWPAFVLIALAIRLDSPGPAFFVQERRGYRGRTIRVVKFRTMKVEGATSKDPRIAAMTQNADRRVTRLGRFLRKTRLDELPQVINILRGEMSWIGPRPEAMALSDWYEGELPFYRYRHIVKPGISGWAQVNQGHVAEVDKVLEKLHYDFYYIKNFSLWLDLLIFLKTIETVITAKGAR